MIYEATVTYKSYDDNGRERDNKENYIVESMNTFSEVEQYLLEEFGAFKDFDVTHIKRSKIKEVANGRGNKGDSIWMAELQDVFHKDDGSEELLKYKIAFFSKTYESANVFISEYVKQGYQMVLISLKLTHFEDVI